MSVSQARSHHLRRIVALGATLVLAAGMSACSALKGESSSASSAHTIAPGKTLTVSTSFYPIAYLAEAIGGPLVKVSTVTPSNVEPHDFELSGKETAELGKADLIAYVPGFQPSLDKAVKEVGSGPTVVDLSKPANLVHHEGVEEEHEHGDEAAGGDASAAASEESSEAAHDEHSADSEHSHAEGEEHGSDLDPHFWLDPQRMIAVAEAMEASFAKIDPANANDYKTGLDKLKTALTNLDTQYSTGLSTCQRTTFVTSHAAFGYMADRYKLTQASISGIDPETEPSPAELANIKSVVQSTGTTTIFTEELVSPTTAQAIAAETGAETNVLSPLESKPERGDYTDAMTTNLDRLKIALACQ
ncbi:zinc ABC transporter substrate-binding protein [Actinomyces viscosus]|uniref:Probable zinc transport system zinc-binding lipoprotein AdcA n=1 Tax=Actinomyces viscosus TaxID=1656 RepID=A0A3S4X7X9_ACTVI|nr:metal ABC transporter substrate-binding protein [Actinomyces viscosus]TFH53015.1 zinc ABC transporter substrate-binding protein [Actinomyces viscosus]VEI14660.1 Probable zinc transport system zinc-binding lipoprotein AdcA precursor [Actinomyces viscosus]